MNREIRRKLKFYSTLNYPMVIRKCVEDKMKTYYFITFPDLKGCMTHSFSWNKIQEEAAIIKKIWMESTLERGGYIPLPLNYIDDKIQKILSELEKLPSKMYSERKCMIGKLRMQLIFLKKAVLRNNDI